MTQHRLDRHRITGDLILGYCSCGLWHELANEADDVTDDAGLIAVATRFVDHLEDIQATTYPKDSDVIADRPDYPGDDYPGVVRNADWRPRPDPVDWRLRKHDTPTMIELPDGTHIRADLPAELLHAVINASLNR